MHFKLPEDSGCHLTITPQCCCARTLSLAPVIPVKLGPDSGHTVSGQLVPFKLKYVSERQKQPVPAFLRGKDQKVSPLNIRIIFTSEVTPLGLNFLIHNVRARLRVNNVPFNSNILQIYDSLNSRIQMGARIKLATFGAQVNQ